MTQNVDRKEGGSEGQGGWRAAQAFIITSVNHNLSAPDLLMFGYIISIEAQFYG